jgi:hypothetical protein
VSKKLTTPFGYNVGINYESWSMGRTNYDIAADLAAITQHINLIKTYHDAAVGTNQIEIDPTQQQVIDYVVNSQSQQAIELVMGTNNNALAAGGYGQPWSPGLMTSRAYTDQWVSMLIQAFGDAGKVTGHLKAILPGNEVDANGPPSSDKNDFDQYYANWIPSAFENLKASLINAGLGGIPVSTIIANYPLGDPGTNIVASSVTSYINDHWSSPWNNNTPFVFFNQYTADAGQSTDFGAVITYFENVEAKLPAGPEVFVGETGYSAEFGESNEASVISELFAWLISQYSSNQGLTIPLFVFQAFDHSGKSPGQQQMGIFAQDANDKPAGLKAGITIPGWVSQPIP